jgi:hypothetical protein
LEQRGLQEQMLVVCMGEFGKAPLTEHFVSILRSHGVTGVPCDEWQVQGIE